jgi:hypothetical protein
MAELLARLAKLSPKRLALLAADLQAKVDHLERACTEPVASSGVGCRFPGAAIRKRSEGTFHASTLPSSGRSEFRIEGGHRRSLPATS